MLNSNQSRYLTSVLCEVRRHLDTVEAIVERTSPLAEEYTPDLAAQESAALRARIAQVRTEIDGLLRDFGLAPCVEKISARWGVRTHLTLAQVECEELSRSKLRGYGPLDEQTFAALSARVRALHAMLGLCVRELG